MTIPAEAKCRKGGLHEWSDSTEFHDAILETCIRCSKRMIWKKDRFGRMDNRKYLRAHLRSFAQPAGPTAKFFALAYGEDAWKKAVREKPNKEMPNWEIAGVEAHKYLRELRSEKTVH